MRAIYIIVSLAAILSCNQHVEPTITFSLKDDVLLIENKSNKDYLVPTWKGEVLLSEDLIYDCSGNSLVSIRSNLVFQDKLDTLQSGQTKEFKFNLPIALDLENKYGGRLAHGINLYDLRYFSKHPFEEGSVFTQYIMSNEQGGLVMLGNFTPSKDEIPIITSVPCRK